MLWKQRLGRRELLLDHPAHHHYLLLLRQRLGQWLRMRQQLRLWVRLRQRLLLNRVNRVRKGGAAAPLLPAGNPDKRNMLQGR